MVGVAESAMRRVVAEVEVAVVVLVIVAMLAVVGVVLP